MELDYDLIDFDTTCNFDPTLAMAESDVTYKGTTSLHNTVDCWASSCYCSSNSFLALVPELNSSQVVLAACINFWYSIKGCYSEGNIKS